MGGPGCFHPRLTCSLPVPSCPSQGGHAAAALSLTHPLVLKKGGSGFLPKYNNLSAKFREPPPSFSALGQRGGAALRCGEPVARDVLGIAVAPHLLAPALPDGMLLLRRHRAGCLAGNAVHLLLTGISDLGQTRCFWATRNEISLGGCGEGRLQWPPCLPAQGATIKDAKC